MESSPQRVQKAIGWIAAVAGLGLMTLATAARTASTPLDDVTFVVFDTETTGLSAFQDRVIEVGAIKYYHGKVVESRNWLINPRREVPAIVTRVHGITTDMVRDQPTFDQFYPEFEKFIGDSVLMAHNARFDVSFMREEIKRNEQVLPGNPVIDTLKLFRNWFPDSKSHRLGPLATYLGIHSKRVFHRADADSEYLLLILQKGLTQHPESDTLDELFTQAGGPLSFKTAPRASKR